MAAEFCRACRLAASQVGRRLLPNLAFLCNNWPVLDTEPDKIPESGMDDNSFEDLIENLFDGVYLPSTYTTPSLTVTVYDKPVEIPWGID